MGRTRTVPEEAGIDDWPLPHWIHVEGHASTSGTISHWKAHQHQFVSGERGGDPYSLCGWCGLEPHDSIHEGRQRRLV